MEFCVGSVETLNSFTCFCFLYFILYYIITKKKKKEMVYV